MAYDLTHHVWVGAEARRPRTTARNAVTEFLRAKLNDPAGPYYELLGLGQAISGSAELTRAVVTPSQELADALYNGSGGKNPLIYIVDGGVEHKRMGREIDGVRYVGTLHLLTFLFDMGVNTDRSTAKNPVSDIQRESLLADFVTDALRAGRRELSDAGIQEVDIQPNAEMQMAGRGRNPHTLTLAFPALENYEP